MSATPSDSSNRPLNRSTRDDSAYGGQKFDLEQAKVHEDELAPELQLNRKGVGKTCFTLLPPYKTECICTSIAVCTQYLANILCPVRSPCTDIRHWLLHAHHACIVCLSSVHESTTSKHGSCMDGHHDSWQCQHASHATRPGMPSSEAT